MHEEEEKETCPWCDDDAGVLCLVHLAQTPCVHAAQRDECLYCDPIIPEAFFRAISRGSKDDT